MARNMYGATSADFTVTAAGRVVPGAVLTVWTARTGGTQVTDLLDADSVAATTVTSGGDGSVVFYGPDETRDTLWLSSGQGSRVAVRPVSILGTPAELAIGTVTTGTAAVTISGDETAGYELDFVLPSAGANGVDTAAIQAKAVTAAKIADDTITATQIAANAVGASELADGAVDTAAVADSAITTAKLAVRPGNQATANQATGGDTLGDTTGFSGGSCTVARTTDHAWQGTGSITGADTATDAYGAVRFYEPGGYTGTVEAGVTYTFVVYVKNVSGTRRRDLNIGWYTSGGALISTSGIVHTQLSANGWTRLRVTAAAPATAANVCAYVMTYDTGAIGDMIAVDGFGWWVGTGGAWSDPATVLATPGVGVLTDETGYAAGVRPGYVGNLATMRQAMCDGLEGFCTNPSSLSTLDLTTTDQISGTCSVTVTSTITGAYQNLYLAADKTEYLTFIPVDHPGERYTLTAKVKATSGARSVRNDVQWYTSAGSVISTTVGTETTTVLGQVVTLKDSHLAPTNAAYALCNFPTMTEGSIGDVLVFDEIGFWRGVGGEWAPPGQQIMGVSASGTPRLTLPTDISAVVGDTLQVFARGVIEHPDPHRLAQSWVSAKGSAFPRFWEFTPAGGDVGTTVLTVTVVDREQAVTNTGSTNIVVKEAANPSALKTVACIGDSLTAGAEWPQEAYRRLTQSGGTPAGKGFANYDFVGAVPFGSYPTQGCFGTGGWTYSTYMGASSPFWSGGAFDIKAWFDANNAGVGPDLAIILLGWNTMVTSGYAGGNAAYLADAKAFLDKLHTQYASCKVVLLGLQTPSPNGGLGDDYGASSSEQFYAKLRAANGRNLATKSIAADAGYSSWVRYADLGCQFDADNNYPSSSVAVNTRNTATETRQTNGVHPDTTGQMQIADVAYREIVRTFN